MKKIVVMVIHPHPRVFSDNKIPELRDFLSGMIEKKYGLSVQVRPLPELFGQPGHRNDPTSVRVIYPEDYEGMVLNQDEILAEVNRYSERKFGKTSTQQSAEVIEGGFKMFLLLLKALIDPLKPKKDTGS